MTGYFFFLFGVPLVLIVGFLLKDWLKRPVESTPPAQPLPETTPSSQRHGNVA